MNRKVARVAGLNPWGSALDAFHAADEPAVFGVGRGVAPHGPVTHVPLRLLEAELVVADSRVVEFGATTGKPTNRATMASQPYAARALRSPSPATDPAVPCTTLSYSPRCGLAQGTGSKLDPNCNQGYNGSNSWRRYRGLQYSVIMEAVGLTASSDAGRWYRR